MSWMSILAEKTKTLWKTQRTTTYCKPKDH